jgi:hypothetical protein
VRIARPQLPVHIELPGIVMRLRSGKTVTDRRRCYRPCVS